MIWKYLFEGPWIVFMAYWLLAASEDATHSEKRTIRLALRDCVRRSHRLYVLMFDGDADIGVFGHKVFPRIFGITVVGIILIWAGIALAIWARWHLGQYWSGRITIKEDHKLIRTGPYASLRHPIYSGLDLAVIGSALAIDHWRCVAGVCVIMLGFWVKAKREEAMLSAQFGEDFEEHRRQTGFLFPRLW